MKSEFLQTHIILENRKIWGSLSHLDNLTPGSVLIPNSNGVLTNIHIGEEANCLRIAIHILLVIFSFATIYIAIQVNSKVSQAFTYIEITCFTIECRIPGFPTQFPTSFWLFLSIYFLFYRKLSFIISILFHLVCNQHCSDCVTVVNILCMS